MPAAMTYSQRLESEHNRFWSKVRVDEVSGCWLWAGWTDRDGYGCFSDANEKFLRAHRYAYSTRRGEIPPGLQLDHLCRVKRCVNPDHLEPVSAAENVRRRVIAKTLCKRGHPYDTSTDKRVCKVCRSEYLKQYSIMRVGNSND